MIDNKNNMIDKKCSFYLKEHSIMKRTLNLQKSKH